MFDIENKCICGKQEDIMHIYQSEVLNTGEQLELEYEKIFEGKFLNKRIEDFFFKLKKGEQEHRTWCCNNVQPPSFISYSDI
jgi:hypothetical protein